jgi:hypothetical protein
MPSLTPAELERALQSANPGVLLLPPRLLRRVIKEDRDIGGLGLQVPHRRTYTISRDRLLRWIPRDELNLDGEGRLPATLLLLTRPEAGELAEMPAGDVLRRYWRLLFHARIHAALERHVAEGKLTPEVVAARIECLGPVAFAEIRFVLEQERYLLPPADDTTTYIEFAALYLELRHFAADLPAVYFPTLGRLQHIDNVLDQDIDAARLLAETRPPGAPDLLPPAPLEEEKEPLEATAPPTGDECRRLIAAADRAEWRGNDVRAARLRFRAVRGGAKDQAAAARADLDRLAKRLQAALGLDDAETGDWRTALTPLLGPASEGIWPVEARLLYDLQKVCLDHERAVYAVDVVEWVYSLGRRPVKRLLPGQAEVLQLKHLRSAAHRAPVARIAPQQCRRLEELLHAAVERAERAVRETFRPRVAEVLHDVGMRPINLPEQVALNKMTEELLDRVVDHGHLSMGNLRDAVSGNNLRLPDLSGPRELFRGDKLIRANRRLPVLLDGVYRRGEFYLRWLQRLTSVAFGTAVGRVLVLYVLLPFGGAFVSLEGIQHIGNAVAKLFVAAETAAVQYEQSQTKATSDETDVAEETPVFEPAEPEYLHLATLEATLILGAFLFGLIHSAVFRRFILQGLTWLGRALRALVMDWPAYFFHLAPIRWVLESRPVILFGRFLARPVAAGLLVWGICFVSGLGPRPSFVAGAAAFLAGCFFFNSRLAGELEEALIDWVIQAWQRLSIELLPALFHFIMALFKGFIETLDRVLYTVDEWLRFRQGETSWTFAWKLILGTLWLLISYVLRAYVNLFVEPTTNPIKHFPVVTVSAKLLLPLAPTLYSYQVPLFSALGPGPARAIALFNLLMLPGIFGFLAWELKENWRLYRANQPRTLRPDPVGYHGETIRRLLKPGFHSGTVPKLYRKLRRASRVRQAPSVRNSREGLHHVATAVRHFVERELAYLLELSKDWGNAPLIVYQVAPGCSNIRVGLCCPDRGEEPIWIILEQKDRLLTANRTEPEWLSSLPPESAQAFRLAIAGWYRLAAVDQAGLDALTERPILWQQWVETWEVMQRGRLALVPEATRT